MRKVYKNIIVGSGFSAFVFNRLLKKDFLVITTNENLIKTFPKRKYLTRHLRLLSKKFTSYGLFKYFLKNSLLHDTIIHGGNTNIWGGICNISNLGNKLKDLKKIINFKKIDKDTTGSFSTNNYLYQMQGKGKNINSIFNCSKYFKNLIYGHLIDFTINKKNLICLNVKKKKIEKYYCKNLILAVNTIQLIEILINSNILNDKDKLSINEHQFRTKVSFTPNLNDQKKDDLILSYSISGIIKHALGKRINFNMYIFKFLNKFPFYYHQIFNKKKVLALYRIDKPNKVIKEIPKQTVYGFGKSVHYFNMKINNIAVSRILSKKNKNIFGISSPFVTSKTPGPISNCLIEKSIFLSDKLNK